jgi:D-glycero-alpha-D-manno-heptose 1-phosphate guanylyltransferase
LKRHTDTKSVFTMVLAEPADRTDGGQVFIDEQGRITGFKERGGFRSSDAYMSAGMYFMSQSVLKLMPSVRKFSLETEFLPRVVDKRCFGYVTHGRLLDIGTPQRLKKAALFLKKGRIAK